VKKKQVVTKTDFCCDPEGGKQGGKRTILAQGKKDLPQGGGLGREEGGRLVRALGKGKCDLERKVTDAVRQNCSSLGKKWTGFRRGGGLWGGVLYRRLLVLASGTTERSVSRNNSPPRSLHWSGRKWAPASKDWVAEKRALTGKRCQTKTSHRRATPAQQVTRSRKGKKMSLASPSRRSRKKKVPSLTSCGGPGDAA